MGGGKVCSPVLLSSISPVAGNVHLCSFNLLFYTSESQDLTVMVLGKLDLSKSALLQGYSDLDGQAAVLYYLIFDKKVYTKPSA